MGSLKNLGGTYSGIKFSENCVKCLGIYIGGPPHLNLESNWLSKVKKIQASLEVWKTRNLSLMGKVLLLKTIALFKITYTASVLPCPDYVIKKIEALFYDFVWRGTDRIRRLTLINRYERGGIKMPDIR